MIKNWQIARALLIGGGTIYAWALLPTSIKPQIPNNPMHKSEQTITVDVDHANETQVPWRAAGSVQSACKAPLFMRPFEGDAKTVRVLLKFQNRIVADTVVKCAKNGK